LHTTDDIAHPLAWQSIKVRKSHDDELSLIEISTDEKEPGFLTVIDGMLCGATVTEWDETIDKEHLRLVWPEDESALELLPLYQRILLERALNNHSDGWMSLIFTSP
jgi:hypothetical protein